MPIGIGLTIGWRDGRLQFRLDTQLNPSQRRPDVMPRRRQIALGALPQQVPIPDDPGPRGPPRKTTQPFPRGPAANDPVFDIWRSVWKNRLARILGRGSGVVGGAEFMAILLESFSKNRLDKAYWDAVKQRNLAREQRLRTETEVQTIGTETPQPRPEPPEFPVEDFPQMPRREMPALDPGVVIIPGGVPLPAPSPGPISPPSRLPAPIPGTGPGYWPGSPLLNPAPGTPWNPLTMPGRVRPPSRKARPQTNPSARPRWRPGDPVPLTTVGPSMIQGQSLGMNLQPETAAQTQARRCPARKRKRRRLRKRCYKGLYKEGRWDDEVDFTKWVRVDCETGRETSSLI